MLVNPDTMNSYFKDSLPMLVNLGTMNSYFKDSLPMLVNLVTMIPILKRQSHHAGQPR